MSALTDRIAAKHRYLWSNATCGCGFEPVWSEDYGSHIAAVTEAAVREQVARDIRVARDQFERTGMEAVAYDDAARIAEGNGT